mgnify:CR=1 FL=1
MNNKAVVNLDDSRMSSIEMGNTARDSSRNQENAKLVPNQVKQNSISAIFEMDSLL